MICSDCPIKEDSFCSDRVFVTLAVSSKLYSWLIDECERLHRLGYVDRGYRPTPPSLILHVLSSYADSELTRSSLNVRGDINKEFVSLKLFKKDVH